MVSATTQLKLFEHEELRLKFFVTEIARNESSTLVSTSHRSNSRAGPDKVSRDDLYGDDALLKHEQ